MKNEKRAEHLSVVRTARTFTRPTTGLASMGQMLVRPKIQEPQTPPPDNLRWTCPNCGVIEPRAMPTGRWIKRECQCQVNARHARQAKEAQEQWAQEQAVRTFGGWLGDHWVNQRVVREMKLKTFDRWDHDSFPDAYDKAFRFANELKGNLILVGSNGTGKTYIIASILNYLRENGRLLPDGTRQHLGGLFASSSEFFENYYATFNRSSDKTEAIRIIESAISAPLFGLDDPDKLSPTDKRLETLFLIIDERYKARRPTIIASNHEKLEEYLGEGVMSRLMRGMTRIRMVGEDYRIIEEA